MNIGQFHKLATAAKSSSAYIDTHQPQAETKISENQTGFRGVGTRDQIFNLCTIMEKSRENNFMLHLAFIDYSKAFDSVQHSKMWLSLKS